MLLGFISDNSSPESTSELCLVADRPASFSVPVKVRSLEPTDSAVFLLSIEEGITVTLDPEDRGKIITPIAPSVLYLTPNRPDKPGFRVSKVKVLESTDGKFRIYFNRDRGWESWTPNVRLY